VHVINAVTVDAIIHTPVPDIALDVPSETAHAGVLVSMPPVCLTLSLPSSVSSMLGVSPIIAVVPVAVAMEADEPVVETESVVEAEFDLNCIATPLSLLLVLVHGVLKWLQCPLAKYVMLLHADSS